MLEVFVQVQPLKEGEAPRCLSVVGFEDEGDRQAVADMGLRGMIILCNLTVNGVPKPRPWSHPRRHSQQNRQ